MKENKEQKAIYGVSSDAMITTSTDIYYIELLNEEARYDDLDKGKAYILGDYYYLLRGRKPDELEDKDGNRLYKPGIYRDTKGDIFVYHPVTDNEKEEYNYYSALVKYDPNRIVHVLKDKGEALYSNVCDPGKIFKAAVGENDNILNRGMKEVFRRKNIDLKQCVDRFPNKHALTNFKQTMTSPDKKNLTILLFDRGVEALNLKYTLIIEDKDGDLCIGDKLVHPVIVSSEDTIPFR